MIKIAQDKILQLEMEGIRKTNKIEKADRIFEKMNKQIEEALKNGAANDPKMRKELGKKNNEIKKLNQKISEQTKKVREETSLRAQAETDMKSKEGIIETLKEIVVLQKTAIQQAELGRPASLPVNRGQQQEKGTELCRDFYRQGQCFRGQSCKFFHPAGRHPPSTQPTNSRKPDCKHWLEGYCRKSENTCWGKHDPSQCGTKHKQHQTGAESSNNNDINNQNFVESLANAVTQSLVRVHPGFTAPSVGQQQGGFQPTEQIVTGPSRGQQQGGFQPLEQMMKQQTSMRFQQQQPTMPMIMAPNGQCLVFPAQQGRLAQGQ